MKAGGRNWDMDVDGRAYLGSRQASALLIRFRYTGPGEGENRR